MNVENIQSVKLTKPGDTVEGSVSRAHDYLRKNCDHVFDIVLLAGTNDLLKRKIRTSRASTKFLVKALDSINELKGFSSF